MNLRLGLSALLATAPLAACGGSPLDPGAGNDPGSGTATIVAVGTVSARPRIPNSTLPTDFTTEFSVRLSVNGAPVTAGTVTVSSASASIPLTYTSSGGSLGRWEGTGARYDEVYQLDVVSGPDRIAGVRVDGPDIHEITAPGPGANIDSTLATPLTWARDARADVATLALREKDGLTIDDSGAYTIAPATFKSEKDKPRQDEVSLTRSNHVAPAGGAPGSDFTVSVEQHVEVVVLANPNGG